MNRQKSYQELRELGVTGSGGKGERCRHINRETGVLYVLILFLFSSFGYPFMATVGKRMLSKLSLWSVPCAGGTGAALSEISCPMWWLLHKTYSSTPTKLCSFGFGCGYYLQTQWLQHGTNCWVPNFCWKCSGKENLTLPLLCVSFSPAIKWVWRHVCVIRSIVCAAFWKKFQCCSLKPLDKAQNQEKASSFSIAVSPEKFEDGWIIALQSSSAPQWQIRTNIKPKLHSQLHEVTGNFWGRWGEWESN